MLAEFDGLTCPNAYGDTPLIDNDPTSPNEAYFASRGLGRRARGRPGLFIGMLPTWGDKWNQKRGVGPEIFTADNAEAYGEWLGRRYKDAGSSGSSVAIGRSRATRTAIIRAMARGLRAGDGGAHLMTFHPAGRQGSSAWFHDADWLDFNMRQNGHGASTPAATTRRADYDRRPPKPVLDGEPIYEDHPVSFNAKLGHSIAADVRRPLYWDLFCGALATRTGIIPCGRCGSTHAQTNQQPVDAVDRCNQQALQHSAA